MYEARGDYQLIVEHMEEAGVGALKREFERLKAKLAAEGLFALERKRELPRFPRRIGVITSPTGAAIRDILHILARRFPPAGVIIYPTDVQGAAAVPGIIRALAAANARAECDVLIVARGGGSIEDLWAFNDEGVARAIHGKRDPRRERRRTRGRLHHCGFRGGCAGADSLGCRRTRRARPCGVPRRALAHLPTACSSR